MKNKKAVSTTIINIVVITIIIAVVMFYISSLTFAPGAPGTNYKAILYHVSAFFGLSFFLFITIIQGRKKKFLIFPIIMALLYAFSDELHQFLVPGRAASLGDIFLDFIGIALAFSLYSVLLVYRKNHL